MPSSGCSSLKMRSKIFKYGGIFYHSIMLLSILINCVDDSWSWAKTNRWILFFCRRTSIFLLRQNIFLLKLFCRLLLVTTSRYFPCSFLFSCHILINYHLHLHQCFTTFQPRADDRFSLESIVIPNVDYQGSVKKGWEMEIFENIEHKDIVKNAQKRCLYIIIKIPLAILVNLYAYQFRGYKDFKHMLIGSESRGPLGLRITVQKTGAAFLCSPPGNWGQLPNGFKW